MNSAETCVVKLKNVRAWKHRDSVSKQWIEWREREREIDINKRDKIIKNMTQKYCDLKKEFDDLYVTTK